MLIEKWLFLGPTTTIYLHWQMHDLHWCFSNDESTASFTIDYLLNRKIDETITQCKNRGWPILCRGWRQNEEEFFCKEKMGVYKNEGKQTLFEFKRVWDKQKDLTFHVRNTYPTYSLTCLMASLHVCYS